MRYTALLQPAPQYRLGVNPSSPAHVEPHSESFFCVYAPPPYELSHWHQPLCCSAKYFVSKAVHASEQVAVVYPYFLGPNLKSRAELSVKHPTHCNASGFKHGVHVPAGALPYHDLLVYSFCNHEESHGSLGSLVQVVASGIPGYLMPSGQVYFADLQESSIPGFFLLSFSSKIARRHFTL